MEGAFDSAWLKWAMGVVNAQVFESNINALAEQDVLDMPFRTLQKYDAKRHCIVLTVGEVPTFFPPLLGLLLGDLVHDYRSSLDHLVWALYKRGRTPNLGDPDENWIYFPITRSREHFRSSINGRRPKLPGVRRADLAIVRAYQPYKRGQSNLDRHALIILDDLSAGDKHRTIQPIQAVPERATYRLLRERDCVVRRIAPRARRVPLQPGAELARFYVRKTGPNPEIDVKPQFTIDPMVTERASFQEWAITTMRFIAALLSEFGEAPESARHVLGATSHGPRPPWL